ncbi:MAG: hypothetical protein O3A01_07945 [bacterium]|nr:hypothetical protein [bacterium]
MTDKSLGGMCRRIASVVQKPEVTLDFSSGAIGDVPGSVGAECRLSETDNVTPFSYATMRQFFDSPGIRAVIGGFQDAVVKDAWPQINYMLNTFWFTAGREEGMGDSIREAAAWINSHVRFPLEGMVDAGGGCSGLSPFVGLFRTGGERAPFQYRVVDQSAAMVEVNKALWQQLRAHFKGIGHDGKVGDLRMLYTPAGLAELANLSNPTRTLCALTRVLIHLDDGEPGDRPWVLEDDVDLSKAGPTTVYDVVSVARRMGAFMSADAKWGTIKFEYTGEVPANPDALKVLTTVLASGGIPKAKGGMIPNPNVAAKLPEILGRGGFAPENIKVFDGVAETTIRDQALGILPIEGILTVLKGKCIDGIVVTDDLIGGVLALIQDNQFVLSCEYSVVAAVDLSRARSTSEPGPRGSSVLLPKLNARTHSTSPRNASVVVSGGGGASPGFPLEVDAFPVDS